MVGVNGFADQFTVEECRGEELTYIDYTHKNSLLYRCLLNQFTPFASENLKGADITNKRNVQETDITSKKNVQGTDITHVTTFEYMHSMHCIALHTQGMTKPV